MRSYSEEVSSQPVDTEKFAFKRQLKQFWITFWIFRTIRTLMDQSKDLIFLPCSSLWLWGFRCGTCCKNASLFWRRSLTTRNELNQSETHSPDVSHCWTFHAGIKNLILQTRPTLYVWSSQMNLLRNKKQYSNWSYRGKNPWRPR